MRSMPVTVTAKRALRVSLKKQAQNKQRMSQLEAALRVARNKKTATTVAKASSLADRTAKKGLIHKNKAAHIKSQLSKLLPSKKKATKKKK